MSVFRNVNHKPVGGNVHSVFSAPAYRGGGSALTWENTVLTLDNLVAAYRAAATTYETSDGNDINVDKWLDDSGNTFDVTSGSSATHPNFDANGLGDGKAGMVYDGVDNKQQCINANIGNNHVELTDTLTAFWYGKFDLAGAGHNGLFEVGDGGLNTGCQVYIHGTTDNMMFRAFQKDGSYIYIEFNVAAYNLGVHSWTFQYDMPNDTLKVFVDGVDIGGTITRSDGTVDAEEVPDDIDTITIGSPHTSFDFKGTIGTLVLTKDLLTEAEIINLHSVADGGAYSNISLPPRYVVVGDSLSVDPASGGYDPAWTAILATNNPGITVVNEAIAGQTLNTIDGAYASQIGLNYKSAAVSNNLIIFGGTNDMSTGRTPAQAQASIDSIVAAATTTGYDAIYVCNVIDRNPNTYDANIATLNGLIAAGSGYTKIDLASRAELDDGADITYIYDGVHPNVAGHVAIHAEIASVIGLS